MNTWIPVCKNTPDKPEIFGIAETCGVSVSEAFLGFFRLYCWADENTVDGFVPFVSRCQVNAIAKINNFANALERVGWLTVETGGVRFNSWETHNGQSARKRMMDARKHKRHRMSRNSPAKCPGDVPLTTGQMSRCEREKSPVDNGTNAGLQNRTVLTLQEGSENTLHLLSESPECDGTVIDKAAKKTVVEWWNSLATTHVWLTSIRDLPTKRWDKWRLRVKEGMQISDVAAAISQAGEFMRKGTWFSFDWLIENETNWRKLVEGKYRDRPESNTNRPDFNKDF